MNEQPADALPPINLDQQPDNQAKAPSAEKASTGPADQPGTPVPTPATAPPADNSAVPAVVPAAPVDPAVPAIADDVDLIEKEWVERAKMIVEQTKHDPYQQNEAMTKMKTDYLKKRYNRDIKASQS